MIRNPTHTLTFGAITMHPGATSPRGGGIVYDVKSQDTTFGNPAPVTLALLSLMRAGSLVSYDRTDNRDPVLRVTIMAANSDLLAQGEKALQLECEKPNTLTWVPPDGQGEPSVFDIVWSQLELVFDDVQELNLQRVYLVRLQALPHARPEALVITPAVVGGGGGGAPTFTLVDDGSSAAPWSTPPGYTLSVVSGRLRWSRSLSSVADISPTRTGSVAIPSTARFLVVDVATSNAVLTNVQGFGLPFSTTALVQSLGGGLTRYFLSIATGKAGTTIASFRLRLEGTVPVPASTHYIEIDQIQFSDALPFAGTTRQKSMSIIPGGSVRTQGSIQVSHATNALGKTIVYTHPSGTGYQPPLRPWLLSSAAVTTDATMVSGARNPIGSTTTVYQVPVSALPQGRVEVWAWLRETSAITTRQVDWAVASVMGGVTLDYDLRATQVAFTAINGWQLMCLGAAVMPPVDLGPSGFVQVHLHTGISTVEVDEAYLFATDQGRLTIVDCATGTPSAGGPSNRLWVDAPSQDLPHGGVYRGNAADRSDAWHAGFLAEPWQSHDFEPGGTNIFVVTRNTLDAETALEHYRRFHTHVAKDI